MDLIMGIKNKMSMKMHVNALPGQSEIPGLLAVSIAVAVIAAQFTNLLLNSEKFRDGLKDGFEIIKASAAGFLDGLIEGLQPAKEALIELKNNILDMLPDDVDAVVARDDGGTRSEHHLLPDGQRSVGAVYHTTFRDTRPVAYGEIPQPFYVA